MRWICAESWERERSCQIWTLGLESAPDMCQNYCSDWLGHGDRKGHDFLQRDWEGIGHSCDEDSDFEIVGSRFAWGLAKREREEVEAKAERRWAERETRVRKPKTVVGKEWEWEGLCCADLEGYLAKSVPMWHNLNGHVLSVHTPKHLKKYDWTHISLGVI